MTSSIRPTKAWQARAVQGVFAFAGSRQKICYWHLLSLSQARPPQWGFACPGVHATGGATDGSGAFKSGQWPRIAQLLDAQSRSRSHESPFGLHALSLRQQ